MLAQRYDKTDKGREEISQGRKNLRGKIRTVLFLVDGGKDVGAIQQQMALIGAPIDAISQLADEGYIAPLGANVQPAEVVSGDPVTNFRIAKAFMNETIVDARGILSKDTHGTVVRIAPPLNVPREALVWAVGEIRAALRDVEHGTKRAA